MKKDTIPAKQYLLLEEVREACALAAQEAFETASILGLCAEGASECAVGAIRAVNLSALLQRVEPEHMNGVLASDVDQTG